MTTTGRRGVGARVQSLARSAVALLVLGPAPILGLGLVQGASASAATPKIIAVGAENEYANVISQIGGSYVSVGAIASNPNTDPHTFEASPSVAKIVSTADLVVQNGVGYDTFMNKIESASPNHARKV